MFHYAAKPSKPRITTVPRIRRSEDARQLGGSHDQLIDALVEIPRIFRCAIDTAWFERPVHISMRELCLPVVTVRIPICGFVLVVTPHNFVISWNLGRTCHHVERRGTHLTGDVGTPTRSTGIRSQEGSVTNTIATYPEVVHIGREA